MADKKGQLWTQEEDKRLLVNFDGGATLLELRVLLERPAGGIIARLGRYGRICYRNDGWHRVEQTVWAERRETLKSP
jgi:hypothetical protein